MERVQINLGGYQNGSIGQVEIVPMTRLNKFSYIQGHGAYQETKDSSFIFSEGFVTCRRTTDKHDRVTIMATYTGTSPYIIKVKKFRVSAELAKPLLEVLIKRHLPGLIQEVISELKSLNLYKEV